MLNQTMLVGRVHEHKRYGIILTTQRAFRNADGLYESDNIPITLKGDLLTNTRDYCKLGDLIGIRGHIETRGDKVIIVAEKITFLTSKGRGEEDDGI